MAIPWFELVCMLLPTLSFIYAIVVALSRELLGRRTVTNWFGQKPTVVQASHWILALPAVILTLCFFAAVSYQIGDGLIKSEPMQAFLSKLGRMFSRAFQEVPQQIRGSLESSWNSFPPIAIAQILGCILFAIIVLKVITRTWEDVPNASDESLQTSVFGFKLSQAWIWFDMATIMGVFFLAILLALVAVVGVIYFWFFCPSC